MRWVSTRVLPDPAPATTSSGPSWCSTASRWSGLRPCEDRVVVGGVGERAGGSVGRHGSAERTAVRPPSAPVAVAMPAPPALGSPAVPVRKLESTDAFLRHRPRRRPDGRRRRARWRPRCSSTGPSCWPGPPPTPSPPSACRPAARRPGINAKPDDRDDAVSRVRRGGRRRSSPTGRSTSPPAPASPPTTWRRSASSRSTSRSRPAARWRPPRRSSAAAPAGGAAVGRRRRVARPRRRRGGPTPAAATSPRAAPTPTPRCCSSPARPASSTTTPPRACRPGCVVPLTPVPVTAKAYAALDRAGTVLVPDAVSCAAPLLAVADPDGGDPVERVATRRRRARRRPASTPGARWSSGPRRSSATWQDAAALRPPAGLSRRRVSADAAACGGRGRAPGRGRRGSGGRARRRGAR